MPRKMAAHGLSSSLGGGFDSLVVELRISQKHNGNDPWSFGCGLPHRSSRSWCRRILKSEGARDASCERGLGCRIGRKCIVQRTDAMAPDRSRQGAFAGRFPRQVPVQECTCDHRGLLRCAMCLPQATESALHTLPLMLTNVTAPPPPSLASAAGAQTTGRYENGTWRACERSAARTLFRSPRDWRRC